MSEQGKKSSVNWGKLGAGILAGAVVVVGIELVAPGTMKGLYDGIKDLVIRIGADLGIDSAKTAKETAEAAAKVAKEKMENDPANKHEILDGISAWTTKPLGYITGGISDHIGNGIGSMVTKIAAAVGIYMGASYLLSNKSDHAEERTEQYHEGRESFALREDMRKMQAVMVARMQAAGHQPAMALANQPSRT